MFIQFLETYFLKSIVILYFSYLKLFIFGLDVASVDMGYISWSIRQKLEYHTGFAHAFGFARFGTLN